ncbi:pLS20_p028 family conjugation system transmembrane protein, partial [Bacillus thuringiensis]
MTKEEILIQYQDILDLNGIASNIFRWLGQWLLWGLLYINEIVEKVVVQVITSNDFFQYSEINNLRNELSLVVWAILTVTIIAVGYQLMFNKIEKRTNVILNGLLSILFLVGGPILMDNLNKIASAGVKDLHGTPGSLGASIVKSNLADLNFYAKTEFKLADPEGKRINGISEKNIKHIDFNETVDADLASGEAKDALNRKLVLSYDNKLETEKLDNGWFDVFKEAYYRWSLNWGSVLLSLTVTAFALLISIVKVGRIIYELAFHNIFGALVAATDISSGQRLKKIINEIFSCYAVIFCMALLLKIYSLYIGWLATKDFGFMGWGNALLLLAGSWAVIDGPNIVERILGIDAGLQSGWKTMMAGAMAAKAGLDVAKATGNMVKKGATGTASMINKIRGKDDPAGPRMPGVGDSDLNNFDTQNGNDNGNDDDDDDGPPPSGGGGDIDRSDDSEEKDKKTPKGRGGAEAIPGTSSIGSGNNKEVKGKDDSNVNPGGFSTNEESLFDGGKSNIPLPIPVKSSIGPKSAGSKVGAKKPAKNGEKSIDKITPMKNQYDGPIGPHPAGPKAGVGQSTMNGEKAESKITPMKNQYDGPIGPHPAGPKAGVGQSTMNGEKAESKITPMENQYDGPIGPHPAGPKAGVEQSTMNGPKANGSQPAIPGTEQGVVSGSKVNGSQPAIPATGQGVVSGSKVNGSQPAIPATGQGVVSGPKVNESQPAIPGTGQGAVGGPKVNESQPAIPGTGQGAVGGPKVNGSQPAIPATGQGVVSGPKVNESQPAIPGTGQGAVGGPKVNESQPAIPGTGQGAGNGPVVNQPKIQAVPGQSVPAVQGSTPTMSQPAPAVQGSAPTMSQPAPKVQGSAPTMSQPAPKVQGSAPTMSQPAPKVQGSAPTVSQPAPTVQGSTPAMGQSAPALQRTTPTV